MVLNITTILLSAYNNNNNNNNDDNILDSLLSILYISSWHQSYDTRFISIPIL